MVRQGSAKPSSTSSNLVVTSKRFPEASASGIFLFCVVPYQPPRPFVTCGDIFPRSGGSLSSKGEPLAKPVTLQLSRKVCRSAALSQKAALQMPFTFTPPPVKMQCRSFRGRSGIALLKIILPLNTAGARRRPFQIVPLRTSAASGTTPRPRG